MQPDKTIITLQLERNPHHMTHGNNQLGCLYMNGVFIGRTLEDTTKMIPKGLYQVSWCNSPKFNAKRALVYNDAVPATRGIRIHEGNSLKDTEGCILLGLDTHWNVSNEPILRQSKKAIELLGTLLDSIKPSVEQLILVIEGGD